MQNPNESPMARSDGQSVICLLDNSPWVFDLYVAPFEDVLGRPVRPLLHDRQSHEELLETIRQLNPALLLLDGQLNEMEGYDLLRFLLREMPGLRCIGFSSDPAYARPFLDAGAIGFVAKGRDPWETARAVAAAARG
jgi:DNA-binding NarL/FixJ family response regulator